MPRLRAGDFAHLLREVRAVRHNPAFRQVQQNRARSAGDIDDAAVAVLLRELVVKFTKAFVVVVIVGVHYVEIPVVIFRHILVIV